MVWDVVIVGAGPAAWAAAAAMSEQGLRAALIAPAPATPWPATYGGWRDDLRDPALRAALSDVWTGVQVHTGATPRAVSSAYARLDNAAIRSLLADRALHHGLVTVTGTVRALRHERGHTLVLGEGGLAHRARLVVDASGSGTALTAPAAPARRFQTAWGRVVTLERPLPVARWMDFSHTFDREDEPPSFLYALPYADGTVLLEETSLVRGPAFPIDALRARWERRVAALGLRLRAVHAEEAVHIPMDPPLPPTPTQHLPFGAAAGMIHPATGYSVFNALNAAPRLAHVVAHALDRGREEAVAAGWDALWPAEARRRREIHRFGARVVAGFGAADTRAFFDAFFALPEATWRDWLADRLSSASLLTAMASMLPRLPSRTARALLREARRGLFDALPPEHESVPEVS